MTCSARGRALVPRPKLSDAELVCLAVAQVLLGCGSERRWLRLVDQRLGHLFPYLPTPSAYNRRLRRAGPLVALAIQEVALHTPSWHDQLRLVDSTPVPCAASRETVKRSALWPYAGYGYWKSHHRYFWGFRLYVLAGPTGSLSPGAWPPPSLGSVRWSRPCWTTNGSGCGRGCSSWLTRASLAATLSSWSPPTARSWSGPTVPMSRTGTGHWAAGASGSRAPSTPQRPARPGTPPGTHPGRRLC